MKRHLALIRKIFIILIVTFFSVYGCTGLKTEEKPEQKLTPPIEEKIEQPKKEEISSPQPSPHPAPKTTSESPPVVPPTKPLPSQTVPLRTTKIVWDSVNLREGPGLNFKVIGNVKKGTPLSILEDKGSWIKVRMENGTEAWVSKAATSEAPKPPPAGTSTPKPM
jgi:type IV secretory pathway VirB10-like protein